MPERKVNNETVRKLDAMMLLFGAAALVCSIAARCYEQGVTDGASGTRAACAAAHTVGFGEGQAQGYKEGKEATE